MPTAACSMWFANGINGISDKDALLLQVRTELVGYAKLPAWGATSPNPSLNLPSFSAYPQARLPCCLPAFQCPVFLSRECPGHCGLRHAPACLCCRLHSSLLMTRIDAVARVWWRHPFQCPTNAVPAQQPCLHFPQACCMMQHHMLLCCHIALMHLKIPKATRHAQLLLLHS